MGDAALIPAYVTYLYINIIHNIVYTRNVLCGIIFENAWAWTHKKRKPELRRVECDSATRRTIFFCGLSVRITARWVLYSITLWRSEFATHVYIGIVQYYYRPSLLLLFEDLKTRIVPISARRVIYNNIILNRIENAFTCGRRI